MNPVRVVFISQALWLHEFVNIDTFYERSCNVIWMLLEGCEGQKQLRNSPLNEVHNFPTSAERVCSDVRRVFWIPGSDSQDACSG